MFIALVHCLRTDKQNGVIEEVACDVTSCLSWCLLQCALEDKLTVLVGQLQVDVLSGSEFEILVELHQVEVVFGLARFDVDL